MAARIAWTNALLALPIAAAAISLDSIGLSKAAADNPIIASGLRATPEREAYNSSILASFRLVGQANAAIGQATGAAAGQPSSRSDEPPAEELVAEGLGLRFFPPTSAFVRTDSSDGVLRYELIDGRDQPRWRMRVQGLVASRADATVASQVDDYLATMRAGGKPFTVRVDETVAPAAGEPGRLIILANDLGEGAVGMSGWALFPRGEGVFLVMTVLANADDLDAMLPAIRKSLASVRLLTAEAVESERRMRIERGAAILAAIDEAKLRSLANGEASWFRVHRSARGDSPEAELGFVRIRPREGLRGEVDASRAVDSFRGEDKASGLLVELDARSLAPERPDQFTVTQGRFWISWDRREEVWSVRASRHSGRNVTSSAETGVRTPPLTGAPRPKLTVITANAEKAFRQPEEWTVPPNYLAQAEQQLLGFLLPEPPAGGETFILYAYDPATGSLPQRAESWRIEADRRVLETRLSGGPVSLRREFDAAGRLLRRVDSEVLGEVVTEAIAREALETLYRRKGLKLE
jgi:hypothetical protein